MKFGLAEGGMAMIKGRKQEESVIFVFRETVDDYLSSNPMQGCGFGLS
jgi:hypothetical protein